MWFKHASFGISAQRKRLLAGLHHALSDLALARCQTVCLDGSVITTKETSEDFDAWWDVITVQRPSMIPDRTERA